MKTAAPLKIFTIFLFILLIVVFVIYRSGAFSENNLTSAKPMGIEGKKLDTVPAVFRDSVLGAYRKLHMMSGSKSMVVLPDDNHPSMKALVDSLWRQRQRQGVKTIMPGSKSGAIVPGKKQ